MRRLLDAAPFVFFAALLLSRLAQPDLLVFDEIHYVPAAKALVTFQQDLNWVHPPLAKLLMGIGWVLFTKLLKVASELASVRFVAAGFGIWALAGVRGWMRALGFSRSAAQIAVWLTGFNFLWFVQSKTAMLDAFFAGFGIWGALEVYRRDPRKSEWWVGWILLGLATASKWAAGPILVVAFILGRGEIPRKCAGVVVSFATYLLSFFPLLFLKTPALSDGFVAYHERMFAGMDQIASAAHPYLSHWWQWPLLLRPMWYTYEQSPRGDICIWAGGNPALYLVAAPLVVLVAWKAWKTRDRAARALALQYWVPLLFWAIAPRKLQMYYYYLVPSLWLGPIVVWAHERYFSRLRDTRGWLLIGFTILCGLTFIYFLPVMDGRLLAKDAYRRYMWFNSWI
jgi:dolichyl-phosphate-mannose--protein O-mannosyl transferase